MKVKDLKSVLITVKRKQDRTFKYRHDDVGEALGTTGANISKRANNDSDLTTTEIEKIEKHFNVKLMNYVPGILSKMKATIDYITSDDVQKYNNRFEKWHKKNYGVMPGEDSEEVDDYDYTGTTSRYLEEAIDFVRVPYYPELEASCGNGIIAPFSNPNPDNFPISLKYGLNERKKYFVINAFGDSMEKTIFDKEYIIFEDWRDRNNQIVDNKIYFFCYEGRLYIKRLIYNINEVIVLSDNNTKDDNGDLIYKPQVIKKEDMNNLDIYGKFKGKIEND